MVKRPLSPHLSIYKPQLSSATSIIGRLCGIYTYIFIIITLWAIITSIYRYNNPTMPIYMVVMLLKTSSPLVSTICYAITFITVFCFTFFTGTMIRHILWDYDHALTLKTSNAIGYIIIISAILCPLYVVSSIAVMWNYERVKKKWHQSFATFTHPNKVRNHSHRL